MMGATWDIGRMTDGDFAKVRTRGSGSGQHVGRGHEVLDGGNLYHRVLRLSELGCYTMYLVPV